MKKLKLMFTAFIIGVWLALSLNGSGMRTVMADDLLEAIETCDMPGECNQKPEIYESVSGWDSEALEPRKEEMEVVTPKIVAAVTSTASSESAQATTSDADGEMTRTDQVAATTGTTEAGGEPDTTSTAIIPIPAALDEKIDVNATAAGDGASTQQEQVSTEQAEQRSGSSFLADYWWIFLLPLAIPICAILIIILVLYCRRKKNSRRASREDGTITGAHYKVAEEKTVILTLPDDEV